MYTPPPKSPSSENISSAPIVPCTHVRSSCSPSIYDVSSPSKISRTQNSFSVDYSKPPSPSLYCSISPSPLSTSWTKNFTSNSTSLIIPKNKFRPSKFVSASKFSNAFSTTTLSLILSSSSTHRAPFVPAPMAAPAASLWSQAHPSTTSFTPTLCPPCQSC